MRPVELEPRARGRSLEWSWRVRRDLALLEPVGSSERVGHLRGARMIVQKQSVGFGNADLRNAYLAHAERKALLELCESLPADSNEEETQIG